MPRSGPARIAAPFTPAARSSAVCRPPARAPLRAAAGSEKAAKSLPDPASPLFPMGGRQGRPPIPPSGPGRLTAPRPPDASVRGDARARRRVVVLRCWPSAGPPRKRPRGVR